MNGISKVHAICIANNGIGDKASNGPNFERTKSAESGLAPIPLVRKKHGHSGKVQYFTASSGLDNDGSGRGVQPISLATDIMYEK